MNPVWAQVFVLNKSSQHPLTLIAWVGLCAAVCVPITAIAQTSIADWRDRLTAASEWFSAASLITGFSESLATSLLYSVIALALLCLAMAAATFVARVLRLRAEARKAVFNQQWEPYFFARMAGENIAPPPLARRDRLLFLMLWLRFHGYVKDEASDILNSIAHELGLATFATRMMMSWRISKRMVGLSAVALLATPKAVARLPAIAEKDHSRFAYIATEALLRSDPPRGLIALHHSLSTRDWFPAAMAEMIRPHGAPALALVEAAVREADPLHTRRLVRLLEGLGDAAAMPILRERLPRATEPEEVAAIMHALGCMGSFADRELVLAHTHDQSWLVRMECARALGRIGLEEDVETLVNLVRDSSWWVRYRATSALYALAGEAALDARAQVEQDAFAQQMMRHVIAEHAK
jgi:HEAT repeats